MPLNKLHIKQIDGLQSQLSQSLSKVLNVGNTASQNILMGTYSIGIGTSTPTARLQVVGSGTMSANTLLIEDSTNSPILNIKDNANVQIYGVTDNNNFFSDASTDRIGIGTSTPTAKLQIIGNGSGTDSILDLRNSNGKIIRVLRENGEWFHNFHKLSTAHFRLYGQTTSDLVYVRADLETFAIGGALATSRFTVRGSGTSSTTRTALFENNDGVDTMVIKDDGTVGIGTSSPSERLHIDGSLRLVDGTEASGYILTTDATGVASWTASSSLGIGTVGGSGTDNRIARWNGTSDVQDSGIVLTDNDNITGLNNLTMNGSLIVQGDMTINGTTSTINTENLLVEDPIILLASTQSGTPTLDAGIFINRGSGITQSMLWDESSDTFAFISTSDSHKTQGNVSILGYSSLKIGGLTLTDGSEANGYVLTTDATGLASWTASSNVFTPDGNGIYTGNGTVPTSTVATLTDTLTIKDGQTLFLNGATSPTLTLDSAFYAERQETANLSGNIIGGGFGSLLTDQTLTNSTDRVVGQSSTAAWMQTTIGVNLDKSIVDVPQLVGGRYNAQTLGTTGTAAFASGIEVVVKTSLGTTITHGVGCFSHFSGENTGTLSNWYGYYMPDLSGWGTTRPSDTNRWGIYVLDDSLNYLQGKLGLGIATPTAKLHVLGIGTGTSSAFIVENFSGTDLFHILDDGAWSLGYNSVSNNKNNVIIGNSVTSTGSYSVAIGSTPTNITGAHSISIGRSITNTANSGISIGSTSVNTSTSYGIAIGAYTQTTAIETTAIGSGCVASAAGALAFGRTITPGSDNMTNSTSNSVGFGWEETTPSVLFAKTANSYIDSLGDLALGHRNPTEKLDIDGNLIFRYGADRTISIAFTASSIADSLTISSGDTDAIGGTGGDLTLIAGSNTFDGSGGVTNLLGGDNSSGGRELVNINNLMTIESVVGGVGIGSSSPSNKLHVVGDGLYTDTLNTNGRASNILINNTTYTSLNTDEILLRTGRGNFTTTLPTSPNNGQLITFRNANSSGTWTIAATASDSFVNLDGSTSNPTLTTHGSRRYVYNLSGATWYEIT